MVSQIAIVTGCPGWLGNQFVKALVSGLPEVPVFRDPGTRKIRLLIEPTAGPLATAISQNPNIQTFTGDIRDKETLNKIFVGAKDSVVFHMAGVIHPPMVRDFYAINSGGTEKLLDVAIEAGAKRFIHISSNSPFGVNKTEADAFNESSGYNPYMGYGKSKMLAEIAVEEANRRIETVILRAPWFYGPGQPARQTLFFSMIKNGTVPMVGSGDNKRSMTYIDNLCQAMLLSERVAAAAGQKYWISDSHSYTMNQIIDTIELLLETEFAIGVAHKRFRLPGFLSELALLGDWLFQASGLYYPKLHVLSEMNKNIVCSIDKAVTELGYSPKFELVEGMRRSIRSVLADGSKI